MKYLILTAEEALERNHKEALKHLLIQPPVNAGDPSEWWNKITLTTGDVALAIEDSEATEENLEEGEFALLEDDITDLLPEVEV